MLNQGSAIPGREGAASRTLLRERFVLEQPLDSGRFGTIYRARDLHRTGVRAHVRLLTLPEGLGGDEAGLDAFKRDFERLRALSHPNILELYDLDRDGELYFATMEYLGSRSLRMVFDHLDPAQPWTREDVDLLGAVGDALAYAHAHGVVHGGLRPEDVLIGSGNAVKVSFVSACMTRSTPFSVQPRDDIYALARLTYQLLSGIPHEPGVPPKRIEGLPRRRWLALQAALGVRGRTQSSLQEFLNEVGLRPRPQGRRMPRIWMGTAAAGAAVVAALVYALPGSLFDRAAIEAGLADATARAEGRVAALAELVATGAAALRGALVDGPGASGASGASGEVGEAGAGASGEAGEAGGTAPPGETQVAASDAADAPVAGSAADAFAPEPATPDAAPAEPATRDAPAAEPGGGGPSAAGEAASAGPPAADAGGDPEAPAAPAAAGPAPAAPQLRFAGVTSAVSEGQGRVTLHVERAGDGDGAAEFTWWTADGTAVAGDDYADFGRVTERLEAGAERMAITVPITSDSVPEERELFYVYLAQPDAARVDAAQPSRATVIVVDDDG